MSFARRDRSVYLTRRIGWYLAFRTLRGRHTRAASHHLGIKLLTLLWWALEFTVLAILWFKLYLPYLAIKWTCIWCWRGMRRWRKRRALVKALCWKRW